MACGNGLDFAFMAQSVKKGSCGEHYALGKYFGAVGEFYADD